MFHDKNKKNSTEPLGGFVDFFVKGRVFELWQRQREIIMRCSE